MKLASRIVAAVAALAVLMGVARHFMAAKAPPKDAGARAVPVQVATVEKRDVPIWLEGLGLVAAWKQVTVRPQVDGRLDAVLFREGQTVRKGDVLVQIDPRPFEAQLHQAEGSLTRDRAQLTSAKLNLARNIDLRKTNLIAQQQVDDQAALVGQSEGSVQMDQAAVETARLNLDYARVRSPLDGVVGVRLVDPGNLVRAADNSGGLVVITQLDPAAVFITLPQDDLARVVAAMARGDVPVEAWSREGAVKLGAGKLTVIDNQINSATSTLKLKAQLPNAAHTLWPNQFVKARLLVDTRRGAVVVPAAAVQRGPQGTFVYTVGADQKAAARPVELDLITADLALLKKGVEIGEQVVIEGQNQLRPGAAVTLPAPAPAPNKGQGHENKHR